MEEAGLGSYPEASVHEIPLGCLWSSGGIKIRRFGCKQLVLFDLSVCWLLLEEVWGGGGSSGLSLCSDVMWE